MPTYRLVPGVRDLNICSNANRNVDAVRFHPDPLSATQTPIDIIRCSGVASTDFPTSGVGSLYVDKDTGKLYVNTAVNTWALVGGQT